MNLTMITVHIVRLQSAPPFLLDLSSLAFSQNDLLTSAVGFAARRSQLARVNVEETKLLLAFYMCANEPKHSMYKSQPNL